MIDSSASNDGKKPPENGPSKNPGNPSGPDRGNNPPRPKK